MGLTYLTQAASPLTAQKQPYPGVGLCSLPPVTKKPSWNRALTIATDITLAPSRLRELQKEAAAPVSHVLVMPQHGVWYVRRFQPSDLIDVQFDLQRCDRVIQLNFFCRPDDWRGHTRLGEQPRECDLRTRQTPFGRYLAYDVNNLTVRLDGACIEH